jgi:N-glycosylase/DNA lyase
MKIYLDPIKTPFNLDHTLSCGQTFRWEKCGNWWTGVVDQTVIKVKQQNGVLEFQASSSSVDSNLLRHYFRLDDDLPHIYSHIMKDRHMRKATSEFHGLRLLRQQPWECLISYLCATFKNIPAIKQMIFNLSRRFGEVIEFDGGQHRTFPRPQDLAAASVSEIRLCKLGFRAERVLKTARLVSKGDFDLEALKTASYERAKKELISLPGVGPKVANCVLLFSLEKLDAFPIDVWMKRIVLEYYSKYFAPDFVSEIRARNSLSQNQYDVIYAFGKRYFGDYLGYAQEYLYHSRRCAAQ